MPAPRGARARGFGYPMWMIADLDQLLDRALAVRAPLLARRDLDALRLFNGRADGVDGLVIEKFADVLIVQLHEGRLQVGMSELRRLIEELHARLKTRAVYRKWFVRDRARVSEEHAAEHTRPEPWIGTRVEPQLLIQEYGLKFIIRPYDGFSVGLFLEHRDNRRRIGELSAGRRVLNTFAYTCGFSVAATAGGAVGTASVDLHKRYLEWGKENFGANALDLTAHMFFLSDTFEFYKRALRQGRRYDLIVLDPPTFSRSRRPPRVFVLDEQLEELVTGAVELLDPGGWLLLATNDRGITRERMEAALVSAIPHRPCTLIERPELPPDFAGDPEYSKTLLARYE